MGYISTRIDETFFFFFYFTSRELDKNNKKKDSQCISINLSWLLGAMRILKKKKKNFSNNNYRTSFGGFAFFFLEVLDFVLYYNVFIFFPFKYSKESTIFEKTKKANKKKKKRKMRTNHRTWE